MKTEAGNTEELKAEMKRGICRDCRCFVREKKGYFCVADCFLLCFDCVAKEVARDYGFCNVEVCHRPSFLGKTQTAIHCGEIGGYPNIPLIYDSAKHKDKKDDERVISDAGFNLAIFKCEGVFYIESVVSDEDVFEGWIFDDRENKPVEGFYLTHGDLREWAGDLIVPAIDVFEGGGGRVQRRGFE